MRKLIRSQIIYFPQTRVSSAAANYRCQVAYAISENQLHARLDFSTDDEQAADTNNSMSPVVFSCLRSMERAFMPVGVRESGPYQGTLQYTGFRVAQLPSCAHRQIFELGIEDEAYMAMLLAYETLLNVYCLPAPLEAACLYQQGYPMEVQNDLNEELRYWRQRDPGQLPAALRAGPPPVFRIQFNEELLYQAAGLPVLTDNELYLLSTTGAEIDILHTQGS